MIAVLLQLLFLLALLIIIGEPLRAVALKRLGMFSDLDLLQKCIINVFVSGFLMFVLALLPFGFLNLPIIAFIAAFCLIANFVIHRKTLTEFVKISKKEYILKNQTALLTYLAVFLMVIILLSINLSALSTIVFGSVRDESIHSLYVQVIVENHSIPLTLQPYLPEAIIYPQASHVIFSFAYFVLDMNVPQIILYVSVLFKSLSILGAYFLGKKIGASKAYGLSLAFILTFISSWPLNVTWGANPFIVGFPLFLVCLGLLFTLYRKNTFAEVLILGLLVGYNGALILTYFETFLLTAAVISVYFIVRNRNKILPLKKLAVTFLASLLPLSPFLYRFLYFYPYPNHNIGLPVDVVLGGSQQNYLSQSLQWAVDNLSPYFLLRMLTVLFIIAFSLLLIANKDFRNFKDKIIILNWFALAVFASALALSLVSFFLTPDMDVISWGHQGMLLSIPLSIFTLNFFIKIYETIRDGKLQCLTRIVPKKSREALLLTIIVLSVLTAPFMYYRLTADSENLKNTYNVYAITTKSDYELMGWMGANLSSDAVVLVHPFESGLFIPSVSHQKVIFPYTASCESQSYQTLVGLISNNTINATTYHLLQEWNITHVFLASSVAYTNNQYPWWNNDVFFGNPNFQLTMNFSNSYLYKFTKADPNVAFFEDFEHSRWDQNGWHTEQTGYGVGNVTLQDTVNSRVLSIKANAAPVMYNAPANFAYSVEKKLYGLNYSDVTLSYYLNATEGFSGKDTLAIIVTNPAHSEAIVISTPDGIFQNYANAAIMNSNEGVFSYNLSAIWRRAYNSSLPHDAVLQLVNFDFDGKQNVAYIDNVQVKSQP
jgi:hypothetical protein